MYIQKKINFFYFLYFLLLKLAMIISQIRVNWCKAQTVLLFLTPGVIRDFTSWPKFPD